MSAGSNPYASPETPPVAPTSHFTPPLTLVVPALWARAVLLVLLVIGTSLSTNELGELEDQAIILIGGVSLLWLMIAIATIVLWCLWIHRAVTNTRVLGGYTQDTPGWAVGWYFVPFANLIKPLTAVRDVAAYAGVSPPLQAWWGFWVTATLLDRFISKIDNLGLTAVGLGLQLIATYLAVQVVRQINEGQRRLAVERL